MRTLTLAWCLALALALPGCPSAAGSCDCASDSFCCLGTCLPLGSTCPPTDAATDDAARDANAPDAPAIDCAARPTPDGGSAPSASRCMGDAVWYCAGTATPCNADYECTEWLDTAASTYRAACVETGRVPCDLAIGDTCDGTTLVLCQATGSDPIDGPPGLTVRDDCVLRYGPESTCVLDTDGARCTTVACDASSYVSTCLPGEQFAVCEDGVTRYQTCVSTRRCVANDLTAPGATCVPASATTSATRSATFMVLGCAGEALRVAQWGYEWVEACDGSQVCRGTGSAARCRDADAVACDAATHAPTCTPDGIHEVACLDGFTAPRYCGIGLVSGSVPSACDDTTGACVPTTFCGPGTADRCDATGRYRIRCDDTWGREIAESCAGCHTDASGVLVCG